MRTGWQSIERVGTLGVYSTDVIDDLDAITGCTRAQRAGRQVRTEIINTISALIKMQSLI